MMRTRGAHSPWGGAKMIVVTSQRHNVGSLQSELLSELLFVFQGLYHTFTTVMNGSTV